MSGDYSRFTDRPRRRYSGVLMQQGRVQLDADWNEEVDLRERRAQVQALDTFGPAAVPAATTPDGFKVTAAAPDLQLGAGRIYIDGLLAEIFPGEQVDGQAVSYLHQPFLPAPPALPAGDAIVYIDVWQREVTWVEDPELLEKALGGVDTAARRQTVWQVRVQGVAGGQKAECGAALPGPSTGRLSSRAIAPPASDDPCILSPTGGYRGLENRLYRVEAHTGGTIGAARFKWSRENASIVSPVSKIEPDGTVSKLTVGRIGRDKVLRFKVDDWVEILDDHRELMGEPGEMARVTLIDEAAQTITLHRAIPAGGTRAFGANALELRGRHTRVRRWDQTKNLDADGLVTAAPGAWVPLEDGVEVRLSPAAGTVRTGDSWVFAARTVDGSVEELADAPPRGILHHYGQLAAIVGGKVHDCRKLWPPPACCCCSAEVGDGKTSHGDYDDIQKAVDELTQWTPAGEPILICLMPGVHVLRDTVNLLRERITIRGCGRAARVVAPPEAPAFVLAGAFDALENLYLTSEARMALGMAVLSLGDGERIEGSEIETAGAPTILAAGDGLQVLRNRLSHAPAAQEGKEGGEGLLILYRGATRSRVLDNTFGPGLGDGIVLDTYDVADILVRDNDIRAVQGSGIISLQKLQSQTGAPKPGATGRPVEMYLAEAQAATKPDFEKKFRFVLAAPRRVDGLRIERNTITGCVGRFAPRHDELPVHGGIVLTRAAHVLIADNRIEGNGTGRFLGRPVAGIYVRETKGLIVRDNVVVDNGPPPDGERIPGLQGGIVGERLSVVVEAFESDPVPGTAGRRVSLQPDGWPAAAIQGNLVVAPRGPALVLTGIGPMQVTGNRLTARDILGSGQSGEGLADYVGTVLILNTGMPAWVTRQLLAAGFLNTKTVEPSQTSEILTVGGKVQMADNQIQLDLIRGEVELALAATLILSLDDIAFQDNQTECALFIDFLAVDALLFGTMVRATGNGLTESLAFTAISMLAAAFLMCLVTDNQATHCILAECLSPNPTLLTKVPNQQLLCNDVFQGIHLFPQG